MSKITAVVLMCFVSNCMGNSQYSVNQFASREECERARALYQKNTTRTDVVYECLEGVVDPATLRLR